ncbi:MAG: PilW family protein [Thiomonas sp.]
MDRSAFIKLRPCAPRQKGLTLIELMVGLAVALIMSIVIFGVLDFSLNSNKNTSSVSMVNNNVRGALTLLTRDVGSAGFMLGAGQSQCALTLAYDSKMNPSYVSDFPAWAVNQTQGTTLPLGGQASNYPQVGAPAANSTQVLLMTETPSVASYMTTGSKTPTLVPAPVSTAAFGNWTNAMSNGTLQLASAQGLSTGDTGLLQVPMSAGLVCMRVPISSVNATSITSTPGTTYMPGSGYSGFATQIANANFGTLTTSHLQHARLLDMGQSTTALQVIQYWIDDSNGYPVLMRAAYNALTDQIVGQPQAIAPGVVSVQALFGTVPSGAAAGTAPTFKAWSDVQPTDQVVSVALALITRSLYDDASYTAPSAIVVPQPASGLVSPDAFTNYTVSAKEVHRHFQVSTLVIALRDATWD